MKRTSSHPARILIVDDEVEHAKVKAEALQRVGHSCEVAYRGELDWPE